MRKNGEVDLLSLSTTRSEKTLVSLVSTEHPVSTVLEFQQSSSLPSPAD